MINKQGKDTYTYEDYIGFGDDVKCEIIDGYIYDMSPAPSSTHQRILSFLHGEIWSYLKDKKCEVFPAPFDVFFLEENQEFIKSNKIVQPDISVICDKNKIDEKGCIGAPDFIIEIVSPSSKSHDYIRKLNLYNEFKVREYWIVNPESKTILKYNMGIDGFQDPTQYTFNDKIKVKIFDNLIIDMNELNI